MKVFSHVLRELYTHRPHDVAIYLIQAGQADQALTYSELGRRAAGYARAFEQLGLAPGETLVLVLQHGLELVSAFFGAVLHGAIPSIMPFLTEKLHPERYRADLASLIQVTQPACIVTYPDFMSEVKALVQPNSPVRAVVDVSQVGPAVEVDWEALGGMRRLPQDIALLQHSSGTTGLQKGVALSHQAVFNQLASYGRAIHLDPQDVIVSWLPLYHDMGLIACFLLPVFGGVPLVLMSPFDWVRAPQRLFQLVTRYRGSLVWLPNFAYNFCAHKTRDHHLQDIDLSTWRAVINCSEPMHWLSHQVFLERFEKYGLRPGALATCYAMAENVFAVTQAGIDAPVRVDEVDRELFQNQHVAQPASDGRASVRLLSAGPSIENVHVKIVDGQGQPLPDRHIGEVAIQSDCMLTEYYHRPDVTAKSFLDGWYLTGDYGYLAEGELYITGRKKDIIIVGGKNIYPQDLEALAMKSPGVYPGRVVAFGIFDDQVGTEEVVLVAELDKSAVQQREHIAKTIRQNVTQGSAIALRHVHLVERGWLIKTSSGKIARAANRDKYLAEGQSPIW